MKKAITTTFLVVSLSGCGGLPTAQALATPETASQPSQKNTEQGWRQALKTQVVLAKVKVSLRQAQTKLWLEQNKEATLHFLDKARTSLDKGWQSADQKTRVSITELKQQIDQASKLVKDKGQCG